MSKENLLNDNELVQRFIAGDQNSLEILIQRHKGRVFSYILLIVKKQELAEDIFQETFIKVIRSLKKGKYTENGKFVSWVLRISHNLIIDHFRRVKKMPPVPVYVNDEGEVVFKEDIYELDHYIGDNLAIIKHFKIPELTAE